MPELDNAGSGDPAVPKPGIRAERDVRDTAVVVRIAGEIDLATTPEFTQELQAAFELAATQRLGIVVFDLQEVVFFGSSGLAAVLKAHWQGIDSDIALRLVAGNYAILRAFEVAELDKLVAIFPSLDVALAGERGSG